MATFLIKGGNILEGEISVQGSKNASLPALAASLLFESAPTYIGLPQIEDILRMQELLAGIQKNGTIDKSIGEKFRASILTVGPALARFGSVEFPHPGGCLIGARPIDVFLDGWRMMGAIENESGKNFEPRRSSTRFEEGLSANNFLQIHSFKATVPLHGGEYNFPVPSVTGTEGLVMTAVLAKGKTILKNAAIEPEIVHLADFLNKNGADIKGAGTHEIIIEGRAGKLLKPIAPFISPPDRIEAMSFAVLGALAAKNLLIKNIIPEEIEAPLAMLKNAGVEFSISKNNLSVKKPNIFQAIDIKTKEYPGFPTDLQAPFAILLSQCAGKSTIHETIFEGRLKYLEDLKKMGMKVTIQDPHRATIEGPTELRGAFLESPDLRAGLAYVMAALIAKGESQIGNIYQIYRGYENIDNRLINLGADIKKI
jgi:UDP-N-acetylglucosamine 1-carboxyvinyltransferase